MGRKATYFWECNLIAHVSVERWRDLIWLVFDACYLIILVFERFECVEAKIDLRKYRMSFGNES